jgi:ribosomal protein S18 acetylase RimI-like enzyme
VKRCFTISLATNYIAIADLTSHPGGLLLTRINVPVKFRKQGHGNKLLKKVLDAADADGVRLFLHASSSNEKYSDEDLEAWYMRNGFTRLNALMFERAPRSIWCPHCVDDADHTLEHEGKP